MARMNLIIFLERLGDLLESASKVPFTDKVLIDRDEAMQILDSISSALPEEVQRAERISEERERVLVDARKEAERIMRQAEEYAEKLLSENELIRQAKKEAQRIREEAINMASDMERGATSYAQQVLHDLENSLDRTLRTVRKGKEELEGRLKETGDQENKVVPHQPKEKRKAK